MVDTGNVLGAQKAILAEVEAQVGGSAKAYGETLPGKMAKARNAFDEMAAQLMTQLLPAYDGGDREAVRGVGLVAEAPACGKGDRDRDWGRYGRGVDRGVGCGRRC